MMRLSVSCLISVTLFATTVGCTRQCFMSKDDFDNASQLLPSHVENQPDISVQPVSAMVAAPAVVDNADRPPRFLSLQEAVALALENGTVSDTGQGGTGLVNDRLISGVAGSANGQSDHIRVLALNPAISSAAMEQSLARFDAQWVTSMNWTNTDNLVQGLTSFNNGQSASFQSSVVKAFASGGVANVTFQNDYRDLNSPPSGAFGVLNPLYTSRLTFGLEQPLWRDYGVEINQLLNRLPGITGATVPGPVAAAFNNKQIALSQGPQFTGIVTEGILIARIRFDSQRAEFERNVANLIVNVESAYWKLFQAYGQLYTFEEVMRIAHKVWMNADAKYRAGRSGLGEFAPIRGQYEEFRGERLKALGAVLEAERNLRGIIGLPVEDGSRLVPISSPTLAPFQPSWEASLQDALRLRPELVLARENLRIAQLNVINQKNFLKPDLRFVAQYSPVGFGTRLDGNGTFTDGTGNLRPNNAWDSLSSAHFNDWSMGLTLNMPIGYRLEHAAVRAARLSLAQSYALLKDQEDRATRTLTQQYQKVAEWHRRIRIARAERKAYGDAVNVRFRELQVGKTTIADGLLEVQRRLALAMAKEFEAISEYNSALARFEWAKGTMLRYSNVSISEGDLPACSQVRAVENERRRSKALILRERPVPFCHPGRLVGDLDGEPQVLKLQEKMPLPMPSPEQVSSANTVRSPFEPVPVGNVSSVPSASGVPHELPRQAIGKTESSPVAQPAQPVKSLTGEPVIRLPSEPSTSAAPVAVPAATATPAASASSALRTTQPAQHLPQIPALPSNVLSSTLPASPTPPASSATPQASPATLALPPGLPGQGAPPASPAPASPAPASPATSIGVGLPSPNAGYDLVMPPQ